MRRKLKVGDYICLYLGKQDEDLIKILNQVEKIADIKKLVKTTEINDSHSLKEEFQEKEDVPEKEEKINLSLYPEEEEVKEVKREVRDKDFYLNKFFKKK